MDENFLPNISQIFPGWSIVKLVGEGSFGKVYKCVKNELGIEITGALKVISIPQNKSELETVRLEGMNDVAARSYFEEMVNDFTNEIKVMLTLKGAPNIVTVETFKIVEHQGEIGWDIYIFMEFLTTFTNYSTSKEMSEKEVKRFGIDICNGLDICSKKSIIHRDIKPDNLFVDEYGNFKLGDFGVARRLEGTASAMSKKGTYSYMAPEVFFGRKYDNRADIYSLGMVMYKLLNRKREPFVDLEKEFVSYQERTAAVERRRNGEKLPPPVDASPEMAAIILKACAFNPQERFANAAEFKEALENLNSIKTVPVKEPTDKKVPITPVAPPARENRPVQSTVKPPVRENPTVKSTVIPPMNRRSEPSVTKTNYPPARSPMNSTVTPVPPAQPPVRPPMDPPAYSAQENSSPKKVSKLIFVIPAVLLVAAALLALIYFVIIPKTEGSPNGPDRKEKAERTTVSQIEQTETDNTEETEAESEAPVNLDFSGHGNRTVAVGNRFVVAVKADGTLISAGDNEHGQISVSDWRNVVAVAAGDDQTIGLLSDGTVKATGYNDFGECSVGSWTNIVAIASGDDYHTVGLKADGTVVATGLNENGQCNTSSWTDIIAVEAGQYHTVGLRSNGTVVATGSNGLGQCDVGGWTDIVAISAAGDQTFGIKSDGTVVCVGYDEYYETDVDSWNNIRFIASDYDHTVGVKNDGTLVFTGYNDKGEGYVDGWVDVNSIETDELCTAFIDGSGYLWVFGDNTYGQMDISGKGGMKTS